MKRISNFFWNYGSLICGIFFIVGQILAYITMWDTIFCNGIGFFIASSISGIIGILFLLGYIYTR